jgi:hypothetical protein
MKFYLCRCAVCTWNGNKPHRDGQCPVCGNALEVQIRKRRHASSPATKLILSGLSTDPKVTPSLSGLPFVKDYKIPKQALKILLNSGKPIRDRVIESLAKVRSPEHPLQRLAVRFRNRG